MKELNRNNAVDAVDILNDFVGDIVAGVMVLHEYRKFLLNDPKQSDAMVAIQKMCLSYIVLTLFKWIEFYKKYHGFFDGELHSQCKELTKSIENKDIDKFRNKCVGHILDKEKQRPMFNSEVNEKLDFIMQKDIHAFLNWLHNYNGNTYPNSVVSIVEKLYWISTTLAIMKY